MGLAFDLSLDVSSALSLPSLKGLEGSATGHCPARGHASLRCRGAWYWRGLPSSSCPDRLLGLVLVACCPSGLARPRDDDVSIRAHTVLWAPAGPARATRIPILCCWLGAPVWPGLVWWSQTAPAQHGSALVFVLEGTGCLGGIGCGVPLLPLHLPAVPTCVLLWR